MVGARAYNYIKPLQITSLLWVGANAHHYNSEVGASLNCINFGRATDPCMGVVSLLLNAKKYAAKPNYIKYYGQELMTSTYNLTRMNMFLHGIALENQKL